MGSAWRVVAGVERLSEGWENGGKLILRFFFYLCFLPPFSSVDAISFCWQIGAGEWAFKETNFQGLMQVLQSMKFVEKSGSRCCRDFRKYGKGYYFGSFLAEISSRKACKERKREREIFILLLFCFSSLNPNK